MLLLLFGIALLLATLLSEWSHRTVLSSAVLFLAIGFAAGPQGFGIVSVSPDAPIVWGVTELALFTILFSDGLKVSIRELRGAWGLPGRALLVGMPLTALAIALTGHWLLDLPWVEALLVGVVLSPTDPVFASALVGREEVPVKVRQLLNIESGLNDGLALPFVILLISAQNHTPSEAWPLVGEVAGGVVCGATIAAVAGWLRNLPLFNVARSHEALLPFAIAIVIFASARAGGWNEYLAAYTGGLTLATVSPAAREEFHEVGERLNELLKLAAVLLVAITMGSLTAEVPWIDYLFAVVVLTVARLTSIGIALIGSGLHWTERLVAAWFGPRGFASVIYGLMVLRSGVTNAELLFQLIAVTIVASIVVHSSTDVPIVGYFKRQKDPV